MRPCGMASRQLRVLWKDARMYALLPVKVPFVCGAIGAMARLSDAAAVLAVYRMWLGRESQTIGVEGDGAGHFAGIG